MDMSKIKVMRSEGTEEGERAWEVLIKGGEENKLRNADCNDIKEVAQNGGKGEGSWKR